MVSAIAAEVLAIARAREPAVSRMVFSRRCTHVAGDSAGFPYDPNSDPIQRWILQQLDLVHADGSRVWERFYWLAPPQFGGKTIVGIIIQLLHGVTQDRVPVGYALPTIEALEKAWHSKLKPQIRKSGFTDYLPEDGPGSKGGRGHVQQFRHPKTGEWLGSVTFCTPGAYGDTIATMLVDEVDQFRINGVPDLNGLEDLWNRCNAYRQRALRIAVGTLEWDENSTILVLVQDQGACARAWLRCPHCLAYQLVDPEKQLVYDGDTDQAVRESARIECSDCKAKWDEKDRQDAITNLRMCMKGQKVLPGGEIEGPVPQTIALSVLEDAFVCPHARLPELAREDWHSLKEERKGNYEPRRKYFRYRLCRPYVQPAAQGELTNKGLSDRSKLSTYHKRQVPRWVTHLTSGSDVQKNRHYWIVLGHGPDRRWCIVDWGFEMLTPRGEDGKLVEGYEPTPEDRVRVMDMIAGIMRAGWAQQGAPHIRLMPTWNVIDTGYLPEEIVPWVATQPDWVCAKGVGSTPNGKKDDARAEGAPLLTPDLATAMRGILTVSQPKSLSVNLWLIQGGNVRQQLQSGLLRARGSAASGELPKDLPAAESLLLHLTAEAYTRDDKTGNYYWREVRPGNHLLDSAVYALAAGWFEAAYREIYPEHAPSAIPAPVAQVPLDANDPRNRYDVQSRRHTFNGSAPQTTPDGRPYGVRDR